MRKVQAFSMATLVSVLMVCSSAQAKADNIASCAGEIVDPFGRPVPGILVYVSWQYADDIGIHTGNGYCLTDSGGIFVYSFDCGVFNGHVAFGATAYDSRFEEDPEGLGGSTPNAPNQYVWLGIQVIYLIPGGGGDGG